MNINDLAAKPWWQSKIALGVIVSLVSKLLVVSGLTGDIAGDQQEQITNLLVTAVGLAGDAAALLGRLKLQPQDAKPLTLTKAGALVKHDELVLQAERDVAGAVDAQISGLIIDTPKLSVDEPALPQGLVGQAEAFQQERN